MWLNLRHIKIDWLSKKLDTCHIKFIMLKCISSHAYKLDILFKINNVFHTWLLWSIANNSFLSQHRADWQSPILIANDNKKEYEIEAILNKYVINYGWDY